MGSSMDCKNNPCCGDRLSCFGKPKPKFAASPPASPSPAPAAEGTGWAPGFQAGLQAAADYLRACDDYGDRYKADHILLDIETPPPPLAPAPAAVGDDVRSLASRLREYVNNPHHVDPMSDRFRRAISEVATALSTLAADKATLEKLRPHWAQGYSSDSIAAQVTVTALAALWELLEASDQTEAVNKLKTLVADKARVEAERGELSARLATAYRVKAECNDDANRERNLRIAASAAKDERIRELSEALSPFAATAEPIVHDTKDKWDPDAWVKLMDKLTVGDFRRAARALTQPDTAPKETSDDL